MLCKKNIVLYVSIYFKNKLTEKEIRFMVMGGEELNKDSQKVQTSSL